MSATPSIPGFRPEDLPPLPIIISDAVLLQVYTHRSVYARPTHVFEDAPDDPSPDNEKLEHLGDAVLGMCVTTIIRDMYPHIRVGPATKIRAIVVGNPTLASIAVRYQMPKFLRLHPSQAVTLRASPNIQADVFESYVAGVYLTRGIDVVRTWLTVLMTPYIMVAYRAIRMEYGLPVALPPPNLQLPSQQAPTPPESPPTAPPEDDTSSTMGSLALTSQSQMETGVLAISSATSTISLDSATPSGHLCLLNQYLQQRSQAIDWVWTSPDPASGTSTLQWGVQAMLGDQCLGTGEARTKKAAKNMAAIQALEALGVEV